MSDKENNTNKYYANKMTLEDDDNNSSSYKSNYKSYNTNNSTDYINLNDSSPKSQNNTHYANQNSPNYDSLNSNSYQSNRYELPKNSNQQSINANYQNFQVIKNTKSEELEDTREYYIDCAKTTSALVPSSIRKSVAFFNSLFVLGGFSLISFNLYGFIMFYPDTFSESHKKFVLKNSLVLGCVTLGSYFMLKKLYNDSYEVFKGNKSENEVRQLINQFYDVNKENLNKTLESVQVNQSSMDNNQVNQNDSFVDSSSTKH